jgi:polyhydroxyalkanoate synthesis regulator phasin
MSATSPHLIRKYANRKLYDTSTSRYITLNGIWELVCSGHDVRVVEHETGTDITALVLSQIVASHEKTTAIASTPEQAEAAEVRRETLLDYLRRTLVGPAAELGDEVGRRGTEFAAAVQDRLSRSGELAAELSRRRAEVEDMVEVVETAVGRAFESFNFTSRGDLSQLRRRIEELERRVAKVQAELQADLESRRASNGPRPD